MSDRILDYVFQQLRGELGELREQNRKFTARLERAETSGAMPPSTLALAPLAADGAADGDNLYISDGRKTSEGAGLGTGIPAYYDGATDSWRRFSDDAAVTT